MLSKPNFSKPERSYPNTVMILLSTIALFALSLLGWVMMDVPFRGGIDSRVFTLYGEMLGLYGFTLGITVWNLGVSWYMVIELVVPFLSFILFVSLILLIISLVKRQSDKKSTFAYWGFALSALVPAVFIILMLGVSFSVGGGIVRITIAPILSLIISIVAMKFFVKAPKPGKH